MMPNLSFLKSPAAVFRRAAACALLAATLAAGMSPAPARAAANDYPNKPIHLLVPYPAGGPNDVLARLVAQKLTEATGQQVVVENKPGAGGNIAAAAAAKAPADGYTLVLPAMAYGVNPLLFSKVPYRYEDFTTVSIVARGPLVLVAHPSVGVKSVKDLVALARAKPGQITFASGGAGSSSHLAGELFKSVAGVDMQHIPYKGTSEFMSDLLGGRSQVAFASPLVIKPHVQSGALTALGVTSAKRARGWDAVPAIAEAGVPGYEFDAWYALLAPAGTPEDIVAKLNRIVNEGFRAPEVQEKMAGLGVDPAPLTPAQSAAYINAEIAKWTRVVKAANIRLD